MTQLERLSAPTIPTPARDARFGELDRMIATDEFARRLTPEERTALRRKESRRVEPRPRTAPAPAAAMTKAELYRLALRCEEGWRNAPAERAQHRLERQLREAL